VREPDPQRNCLLPAAGSPRPAWEYPEGFTAVVAGAAVDQDLSATSIEPGASTC